MSLQHNTEDILLEKEGNWSESTSWINESFRLHTEP